MSWMLGTVLSAVGLALAGAAPATAAPPTFTGNWVAVDIDGSSLVLTIGVGPTPVVNLFDDGATVCSGATVPPDIAARARGMGVVSGDTLSSDLDVTCRTSPPTDIGVSAFSLTAQPDGTLTDGLGVTYHRR